MVNRTHLKVPGKWLEACGHGSTTRILPVVNVDEGYLFGRPATFVTVMRDGKSWIVHLEVRGAEFCPPPGIAQSTWDLLTDMERLSLLEKIAKGLI